MKRERAGDRLPTGRALGQATERIGVSAVRQGRPRLGQPPLDAPEQGDRGRPRLPIPGLVLRAQVGAERKELCEVGDDADVPLGGDAHETVGVEVVAQQNARVAVVGSEEPRPAVVQEVALVDRLDAEREPLVGKGGEDRELFSLFLRKKRGRPERALGRRLESDRLPRCSCLQSQAASSFAQYEITTSAPARLIAVRLSSAACRSSSQPRAAAAFTIAYSPLTL